MTPGPELRIAVLGLGMMGFVPLGALSTRIRGGRVVVVNDFVPEKAHDLAGRVGARVVDDPIAAPDLEAARP